MSIHPTALFTASAMGQVDDAAVERGIDSHVLMARAGKAAARLCLALKGRGCARIFCGPGNNGGDGYVVARHLLEAGWEVDLWSLVDRASLAGDAAWAAKSCPLEPKPLSQFERQPAHVDIFIDALFGAGLDRPLSQSISDLLKAGSASASTSIAMDLPSGISGDTGEDMAGIYLDADAPLRFDHSITFGAHKFGHVLLPGRSACGKVWLADIGLPRDALETLSSGMINAPINVSQHPSLSPKPSIHKYARGHVGVVCGGDGKHGAGALAASAAIASGAGLVTCIERSEPIMANAPAAIMRAPWPASEALAGFAKERKLSTLVIGPGLGLDERASALLDAALALPISVVLDADALTLISRHQWHHRAHSNCILTPHEGEFARLFPNLSGAKIARFHAALRCTKAALCLKGADSLMGQDGAGHVIVNTNAPSWLATAGSGDVLAGLVAGVWAPGVVPIDAVSIAVHLHGLAGAISPSPLYADQLIEALSHAIACYRGGKSQP